MSDTLQLPPETDRLSLYTALLPQLVALLANEPDDIARMANTCAALRQTFNFFWVGFYRVQNQQLVLGPFQGDIACTRIGYGQGVCGTAWAQRQAILVPDVEQFEGHIACSSLSRSEIVIPLMRNDQVIAVLDVDSHLLNDFDAHDLKYLSQIAQCVAHDA